MDHQEHHEMLLEITHPSGAEEWHCPTCGRRFLMKWPPSYQKIVIEPGDEYIAHSGSKGGLFIGCEIVPPPTAVDETPDYQPTDEAAESEADTDVPLTDELGLWLRWMNDAGLDDRSGERDQ